MARKIIANRIPFLLVRFILFLTKIIPLKWAYALCGCIAFAGSRIRWKRQTIALKNLEIVFPEKSKRDRFLIFRASVRNMLKNYFEIAYLASGRLSGKEILDMVSATGFEYLDASLRGGKGALLYSGHFGNFPLMIIWLALRGYPVAAIYKEAKNFPEDFYGDIMRWYYVTPLKYKSDRMLTSIIIRALKEGKAILIQNDQSHPFGVYINFFNKSVPSPPGPAILAKRVDVPLIPAYIIRDSRDHHKITILPEMKLQQRDSLEEFVQVNTQLQIDWIAKLLEEHPTEWLWMHDRWKRAKD